jgi:hypothetical protein
MFYSWLGSQASRDGSDYDEHPSEGGKLYAPANTMTTLAVDDVYAEIPSAQIVDGTADLSVFEDGSGSYGTTGLPSDAQMLDQRIEVNDSSWDHEGGDYANYATLKMFYDEQELDEKGIEEQHLRMWWWDETSSEWVLGGTDTDGNPGRSTFAGVDSSPDGAWGVGYTGVNTTDNYTWVNATHASSYVQATPEPGSAVLMIIGLLGLALTGRRRRAA